MPETRGPGSSTGGHKNRPDSDRRSLDNSGYSEESYEPKLEEDTGGAFAPIKPSAAADQGDHEPMQKLHSTTSRSIERSWSLNDGFSCHPDCQEAGERVDEKVGDGAQDADFVVGWDEGDAMNPRNFPTLRRWLIVLICSMGSLCA